MTIHTFKIPIYKVSGLFGIANTSICPSHEIMADTLLVLSREKRDSLNIRRSRGDNVFISMEYTCNKWIDVFTISTDSSTPHNSYIVIEALEKYYKTFPSRPFLKSKLILPRKINYDNDVFHISHLPLTAIFDWLQTNVSIEDYQIFNRYKTDLSLWFKNPEHSILFKIAFGDLEL